MNHEQLMMITQSMPMKTIVVGGEDYLERYYVGTLDDGSQDWLHRFLRADSERHLHSHSWDAISTVLCGVYVEQIRKYDGSVYDKFMREGCKNEIARTKVHRIIDVEPNTWTHMRVSPGRDEFWYFIDDDGIRQQMKTSPIDWWKDCKPRGVK
jgi:hypothetical protein